ncbi:MAG: peptide MFS transporter [Acidobacteriota bacterium]|nr:peptide MFS transporter [Acidobacteriota bacterium]
MATANTISSPAVAHMDKHPKGLYVLFATEMWERFSFYSMLALFTLYLQNPDEGFGWSAARATGLYANYLMFVYASPIVGGWLADKKLGYRKAVMIGGFFFMAGHGLLSIRSMPAVYAALTCLVIGNGLFKPNVSTMVGNLYPEGSHLKDRAYNIFYMGINIGAFLAPVVMELVKQRVGNHPAFAIAAFGMVISVAILWKFKKYVEEPKKGAILEEPTGDVAPVAVDAPPEGVSHQGESEDERPTRGGKRASAGASAARAGVMDAVPESKRVFALLVIFAIVIVFWMVFHQNGSTLTYWADDNTDWNVSGTISNAINPFWVVTLTFPLVWLWRYLDMRGKEPATPTKMAIGMTLTGLSFFILFFAAKQGENMVPNESQLTSGNFRVTERTLNNMRAEGVPEDVVSKVGARAVPDDVLKRLESEGVSEGVLQKMKLEVIDEKYAGPDKLMADLQPVLGPELATRYRPQILRHSYLFKVSPFWLILAYAIVTLGELMLSPMGLSLVSKVAPIRMRGLLMGGWFVATAIGNKLTMIGVYWDKWFQSSFFAILGACALVMAVVLVLLLKPLKKAMPGV